MKKKIMICLIISMLILTSCNIISFNKDFSFIENTQKQYQEEVNSFDLTSIKNEQITSLSIKKPESIGFKPYKNEEYVSLEKFDFGDYFPMVKLMVPNSTRYPLIYNYAILSDECSNLNDGEVLYKTFNLCFSLPLSEKQINYYDSNIYNYLGKRRILKISENGDKLMCATIKDVSDLSDNENIYADEHIFDVIIEIFHEKTKIYSENIVKNGWIYECLRKLSSYDSDFNFNEQQSNLQEIYNLSEGTYIEQVINKNLLLVVMSEDFPENKTDTEFYKNGDEINNNDIYIVNTNTSEQNYLGSYMFDSIISPDLKYIIYNRPNGEGAHEYFTKVNKLEDMPKGFFIKNLETSETTFIPVGEEYEVYSSVGWIKRDGLESLMK